MKKTKLLNFAILAMLLIAFTSCEQDSNIVYPDISEDTIAEYCELDDIDGVTYSVESAGNSTVELKIYSEFRWYLDESANDWIAANDETGIRYVILTLTCLENPADVSRTGTITIERTIDDVLSEYTFTIEQAASEPYLALSEDELSFSVTPSTAKEVSVSTNIQGWSVDFVDESGAAVDWVFVESPTGQPYLGGQDLNLQVLKNEDGIERTATMVVTKDGDSETLAELSILQIGSVASPVISLIEDFDFMITWEAMAAATSYELEWTPEGGEPTVVDDLGGTITSYNLNNIDYGDYVGKVSYVLRTVSEGDASEDSNSVEAYNLYGEGSGDGSSAENAIIISSARHLRNVYKNLDKYFIQTENIDLAEFSFEPIVGMEYDPDTLEFAGEFSGEYNGNGKSISNWSYSSSGSYFGLFSNLTGVVKDLNLENVAINGGTHIGAFAYQLTGELSNCEVSGSLTATNYLAGLVCYATGADIEGCTNRASVYSEEYTAGIAVVLYQSIEDSAPTFKNCLNYGTITSTTNSMTGGLIGDVNVNTVTIIDKTLITDIFTIENCGNYGDITYGAVNNGGLVGRAAIYLNIINSFNEGNINAKNASAGIISLANSGYLKLENCYNAGVISIENGSRGAAGLIQEWDYDGGELIINNCFNYGYVDDCGTGKITSGLISDIDGWVDALSLGGAYTIDSSTQIVFDDFVLDSNYFEISTAEFASQSTFTSFDFTSTWVMGDEYPLLQWSK